MTPVTPIQIRLPDEERDALDAFRREQQNPPSRAQAVRALIRKALSEGLPSALDGARLTPGSLPSVQVRAKDVQICD
jgi:hypothetical protein